MLTLNGFLIKCFGAIMQLARTEVIFMHNEDMLEDFNYLANKAKEFKPKEFEVLFFDSNGHLSYDEEEFKNLCNYLGMNDEGATLYCEKCGEKNPLEVDYRFRGNRHNTVPAKLKVATKTWLYFGENDEWGLGSDKGWIKRYDLITTGQLFIMYSLRCKNDDSHANPFGVLLEVQDMKVRVIKVDTKYIFLNKYI